MDFLRRLCDNIGKNLKEEKMRNKLISILALLALLLSLVSCNLIPGNSGNGTVAPETPSTETEHVHFFAKRTCTEPEICECGATFGEPLGHSMRSATCTEAATCQREGCAYIGDGATGHSLVFVPDGEICYFTCTSCKMMQKLDTVYYLDGTNHENMVGVENRDKYTTHEGTHNPVITENGEYQFLNLTGESEQMQLWVPTNKKHEHDFKAENGAVGFFSFRINAQMQDSFGMKFVDTRASGSRWSAEWCITEPFFELSNLYFKENKTMITVRGWDDVSLTELEVTTDDGFSGWIDVVIGIELDSETDSIILHYYVNGSYSTTLQKPLTTSTDGINTVYINGYSNKVDMGMYIDDIVFAYAIDTEWIFE